MLLVRPLEDSLREIKILKGLMSVCSVCKEVKTVDEDTQNDNGITIDRYIQENSNILFSHGYCPDCHQKALNKIEELKKVRKT